MEQQTEEQIIKELTEREYRLLPFYSYSSVKDFIKSKLFYYKKYICKEHIDETKDQEIEGIRFGSLVDCLKFSPEDFTNRYQISTAEKPTGQMLSFVDEMYRLCTKNTNEQGVLCTGLDLLIEEAYSIVGFKRDSLDKIKAKFLDEKIGFDYFIEITHRGDRVIITPDELKWGQDLVEYMNQHPHTRDLMNLENSEKYEIQDQLKLTTNIAGVKVKLMSDRVIRNKDTHTIVPTDLKVMGNNEMFPYNYLKLKYYIQNAVYTTGLRQTNPGWIVKPLAFITIDKYRQNDPIIYQTSEKQYQEAMYGFSIEGRKYKGLLQALEELKWCENNSIWTTSKDIYERKGFTDLVLTGQLEIE